MTPPPIDVRAMITPLRLIFWGGLLCVLDFSFSQTVNGSGWQFDILNDLVGMLMITWAVSRLRSAHAAHPYQGMMTYVFISSILSSFNAFHSHFIYDTPIAILLLSTLISLNGLVAIVVFCLAMRRLCEAAELWRSHASWKVTLILFVVIYLLPLGLFYLAAIGALLTGSSFNIDLGVGGLVLIPVFFVPLIHLFISTSRMRADAQAIS